MLKKCTGFLLIVGMLTSMFSVPGFGVTSEIQLLSTDENITEEITDWRVWPSEGLTTSQGSVGVSDEDALSLGYSVAGWPEVKAPGTLLGGLVDAGYYDSLFGEKDVYFDDNLYKIPDTDFEKPWWYRASFNLPADQADKKVLLTFEGINYSADIYVNGVKLENQHANVPEEMLLNHNSDGTLGPNGGELNATGTGANSINYAYSETSMSSQCRATMQNHLVVPDAKYNDEFYDVYSKQFIGSYRTYELDITDQVNEGNNIICVKVQRPWYIRDLTWMWIDWITGVPDNNMGITGSVTVSTSNEVRIGNPFVSSKVSEDLKTADLSLYVDLSDMEGAGDVSGTLIATINKPAGGGRLLQISKNVIVPSGAYSKEYALTPAEFPELSVSDPELWWPYLSGDQPLYTVDYEFVIDGVTSDKASQRFGIREIYAEINTSSYALGENTNLTDSNRSGTENELALNSQMLQIYVNHRPIVAKGGGFGPSDLLWRNDEVKNRAAIDYAKYMGYNMLRDEGKFDKSSIDYMDEQGIMLFTGWACCDRWQEPGRLNKGERFIAYESLYSLIRYYRQHPAFVNMANGSDEPPSISGNGANGAAVEYGYFTVEAKTRLHEHATIAASGASYLGGTVTDGVRETRNGVSTGFHMNECYDYQPPQFYFQSRKGVYGFVSEGGGAGGSIPVIETIKSILPNDQLWPYNIGEEGDGKQNNARWNMHAARGNFRHYDWSNFALDQHYGTSETLEEFIMKSQVQQYDAQRANHEAVNVNRYKNVSGHVVWMYNNAWPMFYWNTYDNLLNPHGSTYGVRKGNEPVHIMYDTYNQEISVVNNTQDAYADATATAWIYDINGNVIGSLSKELDVDKDLASPAVDYGMLGGSFVRRTPHRVGLQLDDSGNIVDKTYDFYGKITDAYGVSKLWGKKELSDALTAPLSSVYFLRLELKDASGEVISYNSYALSTKEDVIDTASTHYARPSVLQYADLTKLNELPAVELDMSVQSETSGSKVTETVTITNSKAKNGDAIAYAVELKARIDDNKLVAPVFYSDNLFTLFPDETRVITVTYDKEDANYNGIAAIEYTCYNNVCGDNTSRIPDIQRTDIALGKPGAASSSANVTSVNGTAGGAAAAITSNANNPMSRAIVPGRVSNLTSGWGNATTDADNPWIQVDLGSVKKIDRVNLRWSYIHRPDKVVVEISDNGTDWTEAAVWDNPSGSSFSDIFFDSAKEARYVRIEPAGHRKAVSAMGVMGNSGGITSWNGTLAVAAQTQFALVSFEVYSFGNSVFLDIQGDSKVKVNDAEVYTSADSVDQRLVWVDGNTVKLTFMPAGPEDFTVLRDGRDITAMLDESNSIVLNDLSYDGAITILSNHTVTFNSSGGSDVSSIEVRHNSLITAPAAPTKFGYTFAGWYRDSSLTSAWDFDSDTVTESLTLYAKWDEAIIEYTVTFNSNGGSSVASERVNSGEKLQKPSNPTRDGYTFAGWYKDSGLAYAWDFDSDTVTKNLTLYAKWDTLPEGTVIVIVTKADGTVITTETRKNGIEIVSTTAKAGRTTAEVKVPDGEDPGTVHIPLDVTYGSVAYIVNTDGSRELVKKSYPAAAGVVVPVSGPVHLEIVDNSKTFDDVKSSAWYNNAVNFVSSHELFQGTAARTFSPDAPLTRAMLVTVLHRLEDMPKGSSGTFPDVPSDRWYTEAVAWAKETGITVGTDKGLFEPEANITRESLALMLYRYAELIGIDNTGRADFSKFSDAGSVSPWASEAMSWAISAGIIEGTDDNRLNPLANSSRAEAAAMLMRFIAAMYQ